MIEVVLLIGIAATTWRRRPPRGTGPLIALAISLIIYIVGYTLELGSLRVEAVRWWLKIQYLGIANCPVLMLTAVLAFTGRQHLLKRAGLAALFAVPATTCLLAFTNESHELIWQGIHIDASAGFTRTFFGRGPWYWVHNSYVYVLFAACALELGRAFRVSTGLFRRQVLIVLVAVLFPIGVHLLYLFYPISGGLDPNAFSIMVTAVAIAWGILGYQLWDILPIAHETVLASIRDAVIVVDGRGRIAELNPAAQEVVGTGATQAIGRPVGELWPAWKDLPSVDRSAIRTVLTLEVRGEERHYDVTLAPLTENLAEGCLIVLHDLTEHRRDEERLRLQNVALEAAGEAIMITTRAGRIVWVNSAFTRLTGYTAKEAIGQTPRLLKSGMHDETFYKSLWETILRGEMWRGEIVNRRKDGSLFTDEQGIAPVFDESGSITHFVSIRHDVTQRKQVESLRASLTRTMVHDLRSPLTVIHGALETLEDDGLESSQETRDEALKLSRKHTERLLHLVEAILEVQGLSSGTIPLQRRSMDPGALIAEAVRLSTPLAETRGQRLLAEVSGQLPRFDVDPVLVGRVLQNLIVNALKFSPERSAVRVGAAAEASQVRIEVSDEGPGVENELRPRLFQEFARGAAPSRGNGLGLAFCRLAIEAHGGGIGVESEPGQGARFWFTLPSAGRTSEAPGPKAESLQGDY